MSKKNKDFYVWTMTECIKSTYENWGTDMMSMYSEISRDFPKAIEAINKMYTAFDDTNCYEADLITFENPKYVYEIISNVIPNHTELRFNLSTKSHSKKYDFLEMCSWNEFVPITRIDLMMAILLFTEEFILLPLSSDSIFFTQNKLIVKGTFVTLTIYKTDRETIVSILVNDVINLEYVILN